ncbi:hypothetical protein KIN20_015525 [Parelaphostrongylus tenuis]|uniref:Uncharacterized protein n=1 Tax=Parelaphostrongylus tenuis TaxID=148309 RepID=A0AAD5QMB9_PARTN|nr:hypothetical protein KIN20_015525 [Parelaphostrongylus tenuis]
MRAVVGIGHFRLALNSTTALDVPITLTSALRTKQPIDTITIAGSSQGIFQNRRFVKESVVTQNPIHWCDRADAQGDVTLSCNEPVDLYDFNLLTTTCTTYATGRAPRVWQALVSSWAYGN